MKQEFEHFPKQCKEALKLGNGIKLNNVSQVMIAGMGGSAFPGDVLQAIAGDQITVTVNKDYNLPKIMDKNTLVFAISYSGNTEETISCFDEAVKRGYKVIGITAGGELEEKCREKNVEFIKVPSGIQPRNALGYLCISMLNTLQENKLVNVKLEPIVKDLEKMEKQLQEKGEQIAETLLGKVPLIYSSQKLKCLAYGWKIRINENGKTHCFANQFPELNHNELVGYTTKTADFHTVMIKDKDDHQRIKKRFEITKKLIQEKGFEVTEINTIGSDLTSRIFCTLHLGDWIGYYLAVKKGINPAPVKIVEDLKKELKN